MSAYYNENDPKAAAWLRELIAAGLIAAGHVDERSISDVKPSDLRGFIQCHFFAGIGGWSYALRLAGWPDNRPVWTGSCPCQPFSDAGEGKGVEDPRHLWPVWFPLIRECGPPVVFGEQVASKAALGWLDGVFLDLEGQNYACGAADLCAAGVNAPHIRQRLFWMAYAQSQRHPWSPKTGREARSGAQHDCRLGDSDTHGRAREAAGTSEARGMVHAFQSRLEGHAGDGNDGDESGRIGTEEAGSTPEASGAGRVADPNQQHVDGTGSCAGDDGRERSGSEILRGFWDNFDILPCLDGKARRVESGTFPLAHGIPGRVGLLRGYGNAIVPEVAAEFIQACEEALTTC